MKRVILLAMTLVLTASLFAADEMKKLDFLVGEWKGDASIQMGPGKPEQALQFERVQSKQGGKVLLVEGTGKRKLEDGSAGEVVHDALAVMSWDEATKKYRFDAWTERSGYVEAWMEVGDQKVTWGFDTPQGGKVRYTIVLNDKGQWHETGGFSRDGNTWMPFFEMTLTKVK